MAFTVRIDGLPALKKKLGSTEFKAHMKKGMTKAVVFMEGQLKRGTPVQSGRLRAGWTHKVSFDGMVGEVGNAVRYGPFVEEGTGVFIGKGRIEPVSAKAFAWDDMVRYSIQGMKGRFFVKRTWDNVGGKKLLRFFTKEAEKTLEGK